MNTFSVVLCEIAQEIANRAKRELPPLNIGETVKREWIEKGIYYRETEISGCSFLASYDFGQKKSRYEAVSEGMILLK